MYAVKLMLSSYWNYKLARREKRPTRGSINVKETTFQIGQSYYSITVPHIFSRSQVVSPSYYFHEILHYSKLQNHTHTQTH